MLICHSVSRQQDDRFKYMELQHLWCDLITPPHSRRPSSRAMFAPKCMFPLPSICGHTCVITRYCEATVPPKERWKYRICLSAHFPQTHNYVSASCHISLDSIIIIITGSIVCSRTSVTCTVMHTGNKSLLLRLHPSDHNMNMKLMVSGLSVVLPPHSQRSCLL